MVSSFGALAYYTFKLLQGEVPKDEWVILFGVSSGLASILSLFAIFTASISPKDVQRILDAIEDIKAEEVNLEAHKEGKEAQVSKGMDIYIAEVLKRKDSRHHW